MSAVIHHHTGLTGLLFILLIGWVAGRCRRRDWTLRRLRFKRRRGLWSKQWDRFEREHEGEQ